MKKYRIAAIQGDGIGKVVVPEGIRVIDVAARKAGIQFEWQQFPWGCAYYNETGRMNGDARRLRPIRRLRSLPEIAPTCKVSQSFSTNPVKRCNQKSL